MADIYTYLSQKSLGAVWGHSLCFNSTGTKAYFVSQEATPNRVREVSLSTPWDISTASLSGNTLSPTTYLQGCFIAPDDSGIFICRGQTAGVYDVYQYSLAGDLSTAAYVRTKNFTDAAGTGTAWMFSGCFSPLGNRLILVGNTTSGGLYLTRYNLSAPFNISTAVKAEARAFFSGAFNPSIFASASGRRVYATNRLSTSIYRISLAEEWDLSSWSSTDSTDISNNKISGIAADEENAMLYLLEELNPGKLLAYSFTPFQAEFWTNFSEQTEIMPV